MPPQRPAEAAWPRLQLAGPQAELAPLAEPAARLGLRAQSAGQQALQQAALAAMLGLHGESE